MLHYLLMSNQRDLSGRVTLNMPMVWLPLLLTLLTAALVWVCDWNQSLFFILNHLGPISNDVFWASLTLLGDTLVAFTLLGLFARYRPDIVSAVLLAAIIAVFWVHGLKAIFDTPRPLAILGVDEVNVIGQALRRSSFPSGHTTTAFTLAGVILLKKVQPLLALFILGLAILAGLSRAVVGAHWPLDILAGVFGGWLSASLGVWWSQRWNAKPKRWLSLLMWLFFTVCGVTLLITRESGYPQAIGIQMLISLICIG